MFKTGMTFSFAISLAYAMIAFSTGSAFGGILLILAAVMYAIVYVMYAVPKFGETVLNSIIVNLYGKVE